MSHTYTGLNSHTNNIDTLRERLAWQFANANFVLQWMQRTVQLGPEAEQRRYRALQTMDMVCEVDREIMILRWGE